MIAMLAALDMTTPESRAEALRQVCRVEGNASSAAIDQSTNWALWLSVVAMANSSAQPDLRARIKEALADGYVSVTRFWSDNFTVRAACSEFGSGIPGRWTTSARQPLPSPKDAHFVNW